MFCLSAAAAVRSGLQLTADIRVVTRWAPLMSTAVLQRGDSYLQSPLSPQASIKGWVHVINCIFYFPPRLHYPGSAYRAAASRSGGGKLEFSTADINI